MHRVVCNPELTTLIRNFDLFWHGLKDCLPVNNAQLGYSMVLHKHAILSIDISSVLCGTSHYLGNSVIYIKYKGRKSRVPQSNLGTLE